MFDLKTFGQALRELREKRGVTQEEAITRSEAYSEASSLRKIERGEQRPKRVTIIALMVKGFEVTDPGTIDQMLELAGYSGLTGAEISRWGASPRPTLRIPIPTPQALQKPAIAEVAPKLLKIWDRVIALCVVAAFGLAWDQDWFAWLCCAVYAGLFVVSVLLEAAPEYRKGETSRAAALSGSVILATSLGGTLLNSRKQFLNSSGLWAALAVFLFAAATQWLLVRPALPSYAVVRTRFQPHTAQAAHLKNTLYFLFIVVAFWIPPSHCVVVSGGHYTVNGLASNGAFCVPPLWLWGIFVLVLVLSIPMGSRLLENLRPGPRHNVYTNLFYTRAALYFLLAAICLISYSIHY